MKTLITGVSTRAIAESAAKSCQDIITLDYFGDYDQKKIVENYSLLREFNLHFKAENLINTSDRLDFDNVVYISNFENHPDLLEKISGRARILGNSTDSLRKVRDWRLLREFMMDQNIPYPETLFPGEERNAKSHLKWLLKSTNSGGGTGIKAWEGEKLLETLIVQTQLEGIAASACFLANGKESVVIGLSAQLTGLGEFGASGYKWCGNILPLPLEKEVYLSLSKEIENIVSLFTDQFGLRGACGIDFIIGRDDEGRLRPFVLEINPRYTASMELVETAYGLNIYSLHIQAVEGCLPGFSLARQNNGRFYGKGIVFARNNIEIGDTTGWGDKGRKDIPFLGDQIEQGHPVCTIFTEGSSFDECRTNLVHMADEIRRETGC